VTLGCALIFGPTDKFTSMVKMSCLDLWITYRFYANGENGLILSIRDRGKR
jgi:hypothetical protein